MSAKTMYDLLKQTLEEWIEDKASRLGAALAYYSLFSMAPLVLIAIAMCGFVFGEQAARGQIVAQIQETVGEAGAQAIQDMLVHSSQTGSGLLATFLGLATLLFGASGVFGQLQDALNTIWGVAPKPG